MLVIKKTICNCTVRHTLNISVNYELSVGLVGGEDIEEEAKTRQLEYRKFPQTFSRLTASPRYQQFPLCGHTLYQLVVKEKMETVSGLLCLFQDYTNRNYHNDILVFTDGSKDSDSGHTCV